MSVISKQNVLDLIELGRLNVDPFDRDMFGPGGILTLTLSNRLYLPKHLPEIDPRKPLEENFDSAEIGADGYPLSPGAFALFTTAERLTLGFDVICLLSTHPALAKAGLDLAQTSTLVGPGSDRCLIIESSNRGPSAVRLFAGMKAVKAVFMRVE